MNYLRSFALAFGLAAVPTTCSETKERQPSVDISKLETLSGEIVKVESRQVQAYHSFGDPESRAITKDVPNTYALITVQQQYGNLTDLQEVVKTVAIHPHRNEGTGLEAMTPPLAVGTWVNGMKYYPSKNGKVHEKDIAAIVFHALGTRATAQEIQADGIVHPLY